MRKLTYPAIALILISLLLTSCGSPASPAPTQPPQAPTATQAPASTQASPAGSPEAALTFTGMVTTPQAWTEAEVRAMNTMDVESTNNQGQKSTYTGVPLAKLIELAGIQSDATTLIFIASDGTQAEASLADLKACDQCIVSFRNKGGFSMVLPGFPNNLQVKGVVEIQVK